MIQMYKKINVLLEYLLVILLIVEFNTPYIQFHIVSASISVAVALLLVLLCTFNKKNKKGIVITLALIMGGLPLVFFVERGFLFPYIKIFLIIFPLSYLFLSNIQDPIKIQNLLIKFSDIIIVISIISLFFWTLGSVMGKLGPNLWVPNDWAGPRMIPSYYGVYFETQEAGSMGGTFVRNTGIFNEAPMYNMILCFGLSIEYFVREKKNKIRLFVYILTILTTLSTTGLFYILIVLSYKQIELLWKKNRLVLMVGAILLLTAFVIISSFLMDSKVENGGEGSVTRRGEDILMCINVGLANPVLGVGLFHDSNLEYGTSNSLFTLFAHGGFYVLSLYVISLLLKPVYFFRYRNDAKVLLGYFVLFTFTISLYNFLTIFLVAWGLAISKKMQRNERLTIENNF